MFRTTRFLIRNGRRVASCRQNSSIDGKRGGVDHGNDDANLGSLATLPVCPSTQYLPSLRALASS